VRAVGAPRLTGEDAIRRAVTLESLRALLKKQNLAMPVGEETITIAGTQMNRETLIDRMYARDKAAIDAEVARRVSRDTAGSLEDLA
jgi:hypothetical protein